MKCSKGSGLGKASTTPFRRLGIAEPSLAFSPRHPQAARPIFCAARPTLTSHPSPFTTPFASTAQLLCTSHSMVLMKRKYLLPDPTSFETPLLPTTLTIALDEEDNAVLVRQLGAGGVIGQGDEAVLDEAWGMARERMRVLRGVLEDAEEER